MFRRTMVVLVATVLGLVVGVVPAGAAFVFGPWTVTSPPPLADAVPAPFAHMTDSDCLAEDECVMTGEYIANAGRAAFFNTITGSTSIESRAPLPPDAVLNSQRPVSLSAIDCVPGVGCVATGSYPIWNGHRRVLVETRGVTGGWTASTIPGVPDGGSVTAPLAVYVNLASVACNAERCVAGGYAAEPFPQIPLLYVRDNTISSAPWVQAVGVGAVAAGVTVIQNVACPPQGYCVATGSYVHDGVARSAILVQQADGWHAALTPQPPNTHGLFINALSCWAADNCAGLGFDYVSTDGSLSGLVAVTLIGGQLQPARQLVLPAGTGTQYTGATDLSCVPPGTCVGTGDFDFGPLGGTAGALLIERTTTGDWAANRAPLPAAAVPSYGDLYSVSCVSTDFCVAAGWWGTTVTGRRPLVEVRTTGAWEPRGLDLPIPRTALDLSYLDVVSCAGTRCAAAGQAVFRPYSPDVALVARSSSLTS
jgi:hypothetical protein